MNHFLDPDMDTLRRVAAILGGISDYDNPSDRRDAAELLRSLHDEVIACRDKADSA